MNFSLKHRVVVLGALGYFVDIFDLFLFSVLRVPSLEGLGLGPEAILHQGVSLLNAQMGGLLIGAFVWGPLGDKKGRVSVLYGSILLYSIATLANAFVTTSDQYWLCRLVAGFGLAGELGAAITLVAETLPKKKRGLGTTWVAAVGLTGGIAAAVVAQVVPWRVAYGIGGGMGLLLLLLRLRLHDSDLFLRASNVPRGDLSLLFRSPRRFLRYMLLVFVGLPIWFVAGILMVFAPELGQSLGLSPAPTSAQAVLFSYIGVAIGDFISGLISQSRQSRKQAIGMFLSFLSLGLLLYFAMPFESLIPFYAVCTLLGFGGGYWAVLITTVAEHFGTDLRATATTTVPNLIRAGTIPLTYAFQALSRHTDPLVAALTVGISTVFCAFLALFLLRETYDSDLDFLERKPSS